MIHPSFGRNPTFKAWVHFVSSWIIVAFGQPAWWPFLAPIAATFGYALFWKESLKIPSKRRRFWIALSWFCLVQAVQLSWMTAVQFQGIYIILVWIALCFWLGVQFGLLTLTVGRLPHVAVAALWTLIEWSRLYVFCGFSWNPIGLALTSFIYSLQMASLFGVLGLSFWVVLTNLAVLAKKRAIWLVLALTPYLFGVLHVVYHEKKLKKASSLSVGLVQTALLPPQKIYMKEYGNEFIPPYAQWQRIIDLLKECKQQFDLIVLPEYAVPFSAERAMYSFDMTLHILEGVAGKEILQLIPHIEDQEKVSNHFWSQALANIFSAEVVIGLDAEEGKEHYSAAFHFLPHGFSSRRYEKQVLVPLAEYLPFMWLKQFTKKYGIVEFFTPGKEAKVFHGKVPISVSICYEETFSHVIREGRMKGAEFLVNVTNDNWYPFSKLPKQHFTHARVRAVENGVPLVRACNTGVTAAIDSLGRTIDQIAEEQQAKVLAASVSTYHYQTLYTIWGDWGVVGISLMFILICWIKIYV